MSSTTPYTEEEIQRIRADLDKQLGPEFISTRPAGGGRVSYLEGFKAINLANQIFGFNGWSSEIKGTQVDFVDDHNGSGRVNLGLSITVRITLRDGTYHEDIGYGHIENAKSRAMAFEKCKKEAMTDGLKRALRCFGNALGNCMYDKNYLNQVSKLKAPQSDMVEHQLFRHPSHTPKPIMALPAVAKSALNPSHTRTNGSVANVMLRETPRESLMRQIEGAKPAALPVAAPKVLPPPLFDSLNAEEFDDSFLFSDELDLALDGINELDDYEMNLVLSKEKPDTAKITAPAANPSPDARVLKSPTRKRPHTEMATPDASRGQNLAAAPATPLSDVVTRPELVPETVTFFSAKAATAVQTNLPVPLEVAFDPHFQSPSLRKVYTLDPTKSTPVKRTNIAPSKPLSLSQKVLAPVALPRAPKRVGAPPSASTKRPHVA
ncbi:hypothetical protein BABINDRAFT_165426 [Babjeviella inositovora NRRL Y-12698]|uniref:DNA repair and recombination protein RAD52 n=1 Tax=Babjeviella inositovora NRRL Y-12698 TaxID=984486 RepID=A0A1E3QWB0_9ASCO|nr:uncharacterized protein BABINDRAFT_165426 [Babjeviella inositovora NRRL Y-12698]ODQ81911.1 hypothetical protein BABINDRAFT_165426 [Babjeviella inositovora NRRL Y-12698]